MCSPILYEKETTSDLFPRCQFSQNVSENHEFTEADRFHVQLQCHSEELWALRIVILGARRGVPFLASTPIHPKEFREKTTQFCCTSYLPPPIKSTSNPKQ